MNKIILKNKLLATTAICAISMSTNSFATTSVPEINVDYLNSLTQPKITWQETEAPADDFGYEYEGIIKLGNKYYTYEYHLPSDYTKATREDVNGIRDYVNIAFVNEWGPTFGINGDLSDFTMKADFIHATGDADDGTIFYNPEGSYDEDDNFIPSKFGNIEGVFIDNYDPWGAGAIQNYGHMLDITGDFILNHTGFGDGGAITNREGYIRSIKGNFIGNYARSYWSYYADGGALYNNGTIDSISANFIGNFAYGTLFDDFDPASLVLGGAVFTNNDLTFNSLSDNYIFTGNYTYDVEREKIYNAIYVDLSDSSVASDSGC